MPTTAPARKRSRSQLLSQHAEADEQDELSPRKADMRGKDTPLSNTKKRRLNTYGSSVASGARDSGISSFGRKVGSAIGGLLGWKDRKEKENLGVDELADEEGVNGKGGKGKKDIWDLESSEDETETMKGSARGRKKVDSALAKPTSTPKLKQKINGRNSAKANSHHRAVNELGEEIDIWEIAVSDEEGTAARRSVRRGISSVDRAKASLVSIAKDFSTDSAKKRSPGRPKRSVTTKTEADDEDELEELTTPSRQKKGLGRKVSSPSPDPQPEPKSSARKRGRPKKDLDVIVQEAKQPPKGILTPSKRGRTLKSRKSVAFEQLDDEIDLGFKDLPEPSGIKKGKSRKSGKQEVGQPAEIEEESFEDSEDVACTVCSKLHSRKGNQIVLCDGCDFAVHLKCYQLPSLPEGDWFCRDCQPDQSSDGAEVEEAAQVDVTHEEASSDDEQEIACAICSGLDSKKGNMIILCDSCDFAVHVKCYQLPALPKGDWYCRDCQPDIEEDSLSLQLDDRVALDEVPSNIPDIEGFENHLRVVQRAVLDKLTGQKRIKLRGQDEEMQKVRQVVEQTILAGEGNSMLVIGARGCGKTTLVESVISDLSANHRDSFHVVRLNGFIHTDDKLASREIWRQLGREMEIEDDLTGKTSNYADTLASLLALLSHPSETSESQSDQTAKSVVFILDEFDLFTTHSRQTLLYNLFDIAQARKAPIVVLGLTTRIDVVESLEKRVKSRFSHRYVHLSLPRSLPAFWEICKQGLVVDSEEFVGDDGLDFGAPSKHNFVDFWQSMIEDLYAKDTAFKQHLQSQFFRTKSVPAFFTSCILPIASLSLENFPLTGKRFTMSLLSLSPPDSKLQILQGLSELELALLIAAARLDIILDTDTCNFAMVYDEYSSLTSRHKIQTSSTGVTALGSSAKVWGRDVALGSWERLAEHELLIPAGIGGGGRDSGAAGRMWKVDVGLEEIAGSVEGLSGVMSKWCREI